MSYPTINIDREKVILLSGFEWKRGAKRPLVIKSLTQLESHSERPDPVGRSTFCPGLNSAPRTS